mmetsp:Transcript_145646/g.265187  ORF Transcript_145646/g.265187 Transcript_145646/m.265187 type:complete len:938 (+) Transcript_145646:77-2890(+)
MAAQASFFPLLCVILSDALHAVHGSTCTEKMDDAICKTKRALTQDMLQADGSAVELLQKKSYIKSQADDAKDVNDTEVQEAKQMIDTVISDISAVKSSRAEFNNDKDPDYSRRTIQAELAKKHAEAMISNETTNLQEGSSQEAPEEAPAGLLDYWTLVGEGKWCNNMVGAVKSQHIVAAHGHTKESCQAACARDFSCNFYCFDKSNEGWCTTYEECGVPTTNPNGFSQNLQDAVTYKKENEQTHARAVAEELRNIEAESMSRIFVADAHIKVPTLKEAEKIAYRQAKQALKQKYAEAEAALKQKYAEAEAALQDVPPESSDVDSAEKPADEERKTFEEYDKLADKLLEDMTDKEDEARKMEVGKLKTRVAPPVEEHTKLHERAPPTDTRVKPMIKTADKEAEPAEEEAKPAEEAPKEEAKPAGAPKVEARPHKAHLTQPAKQAPVEEAKPVDEMPKAEAKQADTRLKVEPKPEKQIPKEETLKKEASRGRNAQQSETNVESLTKAIKKIKHPNALAKSAQKPEKEPEQEEEVESEEEPKKQKAEKLRKREEFRLDHDGHAYTKQDFLDYYGDLKAWDMAPEAHMKHLQSRHEITHDVFEEKVSRQPQNKLVPRRQEVAQEDKSSSMQQKSKDARAIEDKANVTVNKTCATTEGAACVFPFVYLGLHYNTCTYVDGKGEPWCVTNKGDMGWLMGKRPEGAFGICNTACQEAGMVDEDNTDAKTWATAELSAPEAEDDDLPWEKEESIKKKRHEKQEEKPQAEPKKEDEDVKHRNDKAKAPAPKIRALKHEEDNSSLGHQKHVLQERVGPSAAASRSANTVTDKLVSRASIMDQVMADQTAEEEAAAAATTVEEVFDSISNALEEAVPAESDAKAACKTVAGAACVFPFVFKGVAYDKCTKAESTSGDAWCATTWANAAWLSGEIPKNEWGKCAPGCEE